MDDELTTAQQATLYTVEHPPLNGHHWLPEEIELAFMAGTIAGLSQAQRILTPGGAA
jgi:hypothetical protein